MNLHFSPMPKGDDRIRADPILPSFPRFVDLSQTDATYPRFSKTFFTANKGCKIIKSPHGCAKRPVEFESLKRDADKRAVSGELCKKIVTAFSSSIKRRVLVL